MLIVTSFPPSAFKIDPTLASDSAVVSSYQLPPCSAGAAPGWLLITASCTNPWEADVLRIWYAVLIIIYPIKAKFAINNKEFCQL
jgi:hypothetical protein